MNVILGALEFQPQYPICLNGPKAFFKSLREHNPTCDCVMFVRNLTPEAINLLDEYKIIQIDKDEYNKKYNIINVGMNAKRRIYYYLWLKQHPNYTDILETDVFDVVFQSDPFNQTFNGELIISEEEKSIGYCRHNSQWINTVYGTEELLQLHNYPILCAGLIRGCFDSIQKMHTIFNEELIKQFNKPWFGALDQGHIEYMFYRRLENYKILPYSNSYMMHIGHTNTTDIQFDKQVISINGITPTIVHQYNRHNELKEKIHEQYR